MTAKKRAEKSAAASTKDTSLLQLVDDKVQNLYREVLALRSDVKQLGERLDDVWNAVRPRPAPAGVVAEVSEPEGDPEDMSENQVVAFDLVNNQRRLVTLKAVDQDGQPLGAWPDGATVQWVSDHPESLQWSGAPKADGTALAANEQWARGRVVGTAAGRAIPSIGGDTPLKGVEFAAAVGNSSLGGVAAEVSDPEADPEG